MLLHEIKSKLSTISQSHLLTYWEKLNSEQKKHLARQIQLLDIETYHEQRRVLTAVPPKSLSKISPLSEYSFSCGNTAAGDHLLAKNKCGCLLIAGGQGTRLQFDAPKGMFPVSVIKHKTLFQLFAEKTVAAGKKAGCLLPLAIMTSPLNHNEIVAHFQSHNFFGLNPGQVSFFQQSTLPFLDVQGNLFLEDKDSLAQGPDGNGSALKSFVDAGLWDAWQQKGVEQVHFVLIDNPLADPYDAELLGFHVAHHADITVKCTQRLHAEEKVGLIVQQEGRIGVVEYSEVSAAESTACLKDGRLKFPFANLSLFCLSMDFIRHAAYENHSKMPLHKAFKAVKYLDTQDISKVSEQPAISFKKIDQLHNGAKEDLAGIAGGQPKAWKFERFIFDVLPFAANVKVLVYPREFCFAPLKNASGPDSLPTVQTALQHLDKYILEKITQLPAPAYPFELAQDFHYPLPALLEKWQGRPAPDSNYINP